MRLTAQEEYGLRCLLQVARRPAGTPVSIPEIAAAEGLSVEYASKLLRELRRAGLVKSARGPGGGYSLERAPREISVWAAIEALGGPLFPDAFCACHGGLNDGCVHETDCSVRALWRSVDGLLRGHLARVTLADLVRGEESMVVWLEEEPAQLGSLR
jgi:Rrf2 family protein